MPKCVFNSNLIQNIHFLGFVEAVNNMFMIQMVVVENFWTAFPSILTLVTITLKQLLLFIDNQKDYQLLKASDLKTKSIIFLKNI